MPIIYACILNKKRAVVTQVLPTKVQGNFRQLALQHMHEFRVWGKEVIHLNAEQKLVYHDLKEYADVCICDSFDIKDIEAHRFLDAFEEKFQEIYNT